MLEGGTELLGKEKKSYPDYPLITIVTAVYNGAKYLEECIESIKRQEYKNFQYIIIDGNSYDGTIDIIKRNNQFIDYWLSENDKGIYDAWNKAILKAKGEWISFIGSDDILLSNALSNYVLFLNEHPQKKFDIVSSQIELVREDLSVIRTVGKAWDWKDFRRYMSIAHVGCLHHHSVFKKYGLFDTNFKIVSDYEFLLRIGSTLKAGFLNQVTAKMRASGKSNDWSLVHKEARRAKVATAQRSVFFSHLEMQIAILKHRIRIFLNI
jgi:glycosyltransferase involved in cell wall biosynthesis